MLTVKNNNDFDFTGRFAGHDYHFPAGKFTAIPDDAARHIFGLGDADKTDVLTRHGWMQTGNQFNQGMATLNNFSFNVAETLEAGAILDELPVYYDTEPIETTEQGSAPLQTGSDGEPTASDGTVVEPSQPTSGGSILDTLNGLTG